MRRSSAARSGSSQKNNNFMRTAIIYSGQARSFARVFPNQWFNVLRKFSNPTVFVSVARDEQAKDMERLYERFSKDQVRIEHVDQPEQPTPPADPKFLACYPPSSPASSILKMFWARERAWEFFKENIYAGGYSTIVHIRPDIAFTRFVCPQVLTMSVDDCFTPWWGRYGGENDRFAVMGPRAAEAYFTVHSQRAKILNSLGGVGSPLHPETMLATALELGGIFPEARLSTEFITVRTDGSTVSCDITAIDYAEFARLR